MLAEGSCILKLSHKTTLLLREHERVLSDEIVLDKFMHASWGELCSLVAAAVRLDPVTFGRTAHRRQSCSELLQRARSSLWSPPRSAKVFPSMDQVEEWLHHGESCGILVEPVDRGVFLTNVEKDGAVGDPVSPFGGS